jgi:uracil-DNA glycosylase family 4
VPEFEDLNSRIVVCERCPRLRAWCRQVAEEKRRSFQHEDYWGKPVPNFGDPGATGLIVGLAPAAHGGNRTGRFFTGDRSGDWLFRSLHRLGAANQATSVSSDDGLSLRRVMVTAVNHCAPPGNKPTRQEIENCRVHLLDTLGLRPWRAFLCLGAIAWTELHRALGARAPRFAHGAVSVLDDGRAVVGSYHPSQQNTFTGKLTEEMLDAAVGVFLQRL